MSKILSGNGVSFPPDAKSKKKGLQSAGGSADIIARLIAQRLSEELKVPVLVENRAGAGSAIGSNYVSKAKPDGYTILLLSGAYSAQAALTKTPLFDPLKDITMVSLITTYPFLMAVHPSAPYQNLQELIAYAKANPGKLSFGSPGNGSSPHLAAEMMKAQSNTFAVHVPYRGAAPAMQDLLAGQIDFMFDPGIGLQHVRSGKLKMLAVGSPKRSPLFPDVPTFTEAGVPGFESTIWHGVLAPAKVPREVVARINREVVKALKMPDVIDRLATQGGNDLVGNTPEEFAQVIKDDLALYAKIIRAAGIKPQ